MATYIQSVTAGALSVVDPNGVVPNAHATRATAALKAYFGQVPDGLGGMRDRTDSEAWLAWFAEVKTRLKQVVEVQEKTTSKKTNVDSIAPIDIT